MYVNIYGFIISTPAFDFISSFSLFANVVLLISCSLIYSCCWCASVAVATYFFRCHYRGNNIMVHTWAICITIHNNCFTEIVRLFARANLAVMINKFDTIDFRVLFQPNVLLEKEKLLYSILKLSFGWLKRGLKRYVKTYDTVLIYLSKELKLKRNEKK